MLALKGDFALHLEALARLGVTATAVRRPEDLETLDGLILPGGESTAMLKLMEGTAMEGALGAFHARGGGLFGTCAGLILLAREVEAPPQRSLGCLDVTVRRNGYGRQVDSFETDLRIPGHGDPFRAVFIRAPRVVRAGAGVQILATHAGEPCLMRQGSVLAATFHPEAGSDPRVHALFLEMLHESIRENAPVSNPESRGGFPESVR